MQLQFSAQDKSYMRRALELARLAAIEQEVPIGAILVLNNEIIAEGYNCPIKTCDPTAHAEIIAIRNAAKNIKNYRLTGATLYVTLEPCLMCCGAIMQARIQKVIFAASDIRWSARKQCGNHTTEYSGGLLVDESQKLLQDFFQRKRELIKNNS